MRSGQRGDVGQSLETYFRHRKYLTASSQGGKHQNVDTLFSCFGSHSTLDRNKCG